MDLTDLLSNALNRCPDRTCVAEGNRALTFAEVDMRADQLQQALLARGLAPGDRVAVLAHSQLEYIEIQIAAQRAGMILVPLNFRLALPELLAQLADCTPALLIHGPGFEQQASASQIAHVWHLGRGGAGDAYDEVIAQFRPRKATQPPDAESTCTILYTSGTTGRAKGATVTNRSMLASVSAVAFEVDMAPGDILLFPMPMFHVAVQLAYAFLYRCGTVVLLRTFEAQRVIDEIARHAATHTVLVPTMISRILELVQPGDHRLGSLRFVIYGASPIPPELLRRAIAALGCEFYQGYGLTEGFCAASLRPEDHDPDTRPHLLSSCGQPSTSWLIRVIDEDGNELPPEQLGEIVLKGPGLMEGYWMDPEATRAALPDGWLRTGDVGYRSQAGYLHLTDRIKDVIVSGGENIYSREVEDAICSHAAVLEAAVIGVPSTAWGESVHAVIVLRTGRTVTPDELIAHCRTKLAGYKAPKSVEFVEDLPKNASGKILKRELRQLHCESA